MGKRVIVTKRGEAVVVAGWQVVVARCLHDKALNAVDRPDIISRLFKCKLDHLIKDFKKHKFFGDIQAAHSSNISVMYTVEFQKCGLPHAHICLFLGAESKFPNASDIDRVITAEIPDKERDPELYELVKYISACEAAWRIFMYDIHYRYPVVEVLPFQCEDGQSIVYNDHDNLCDNVTDPTVKMTMFTEWMNCNKVNEFSRTLRYVQFPRYYVWNAKNRKWNRRKHPYGSIGSVHYVPPSLDACFARGLLDDDKEYVNAVKEASTWSTRDFLMTFFVMLLLSNSISRPGVFWSETKSLLCEDILYQQRKITGIADLDIQQEELENICLSEIEKLLLTNGSIVRNFYDMPSVPDNYVSSSNNRLIMKELSYDRLALQREHDRYWNCSLLLDGGRTAHSRFVIPINIKENSICSIEPNTELGDLIKRATLIIWDEAPMTHKHCFEALDRTMRDISRSSQPNMQSKPFGGKVILFGGDFRQILSVIPKGTRTMIVNASLNSSYIWRHCQVLKLTENMRLRVSCQEADLKEIKEFGEWILKLGDGLLGEENDGEIDIKIPDDLLIHDQVNPISSLISFIYPDMNNFLWDLTYFQQRTILAPTNEVVDSINKELLECLPGEEKVYFSSDSLCQSEEESELNMELFPPDVLNNLRLSGLPNHKLVLKLGAPMMLIRNIDQANGLCNGTLNNFLKRKEPSSSEIPSGNSPSPRPISTPSLPKLVDVDNLPWDPADRIRIIDYHPN
ncbi:uncharacterized protein LOC110914132 [Helianthus annuus]|uniref:uncharacterized protein LOC110914132 n=1 Tax=Helianthus annuus TaxID=4232 RepID=UPI001652FFEE|nr:uncharacterized protein LOC110914132 [Helianthus annuus]